MRCWSFPVGLTSGRSPFTLGMNWLVMNGIMHGMQFAVFNISGIWIIEAQVAPKLHEEFLAGAIRHLLLDEVAFFIWKQAIAPEYIDVFRLIDEVGLVGQHHRHQPVGVHEGHQGRPCQLCCR